MKPDGAVNVTEPPVHKLVEPLAVTIGVANEARVTDAFPIVRQPFFEVTLTDSITAPEAPAVNLILFVPLPDVMVPLVIDHTYVAPVPEEGTEAVTAVAEGHTLVGTVIVALGAANILTVLGVAKVEHPAEVVAVTPNVTDPLAPAV